MNTSPTGADSRRSRRPFVIAAVVVVVVGAIVAVLLTVAGGGTTTGSARASALLTPTATPTASPESTSGPATGPTGGTDGIPRTAAPVALTDAATADNGLRVEITSIRAVKATGTGPGNVSGPAVLVALGIRNDSTSMVSLDTVEVSLAYGDGNTPASPVDDPRTDTATGQLAPGASARATYLFTVPADQHRLVSVFVGPAAGLPQLVFSGRVS